MRNRRAHQADLPGFVDRRLIPGSPAFGGNFAGKNYRERRPQPSAGADFGIPATRRSKGRSTADEQAPSLSRTDRAHPVLRKPASLLARRALRLFGNIMAAFVAIRFVLSHNVRP